MFIKIILFVFCFFHNQILQTSSDKEYVEALTSESSVILEEIGYRGNPFKETLSKRHDIIRLAPFLISITKLYHL